MSGNQIAFFERDRQQTFHIGLSPMERYFQRARESDAIGDLSGRRRCDKSNRGHTPESRANAGISPGSF
jgi:hypothetical protein